VLDDAASALLGNFLFTFKILRQHSVFQRRSDIIPPSVALSLFMILL
jgi:hypothetical protein